MTHTITYPSASESAVQQNVSSRRRLLSPSQLNTVRAMNTAAGRRRYAAGFGDAAPPDDRPLATITVLARP